MGYLGSHLLAHWLSRDSTIYLLDESECMPERVSGYVCVDVTVCVYVCVCVFVCVCWVGCVPL